MDWCAVRSSKKHVYSTRISLCTSCFCMKRSNFATIGGWPFMTDMMDSVEIDLLGICSCVTMKSLIGFSGFSSLVYSGITEKTWLSLMRHDGKSRTDSFISFFLGGATVLSLIVSDDAEARRELFSLASIVICSLLNSKLWHSVWNSTSTSNLGIQRASL